MVRMGMSSVDPYALYKKGHRRMHRGTLAAIECALVAIESAVE
jgi:hypothetical protein